MSPREVPEVVVVVLGTGTEVGKTWCAAKLLAALRDRDLSIAARKPAQSFDPDDDTTDADVLAAATGEEPDQVCPPHRWYRAALAPPMAADRLGEPPISIADLLDEMDWPAGIQVGVVETAGGIRSPLAHDGDSLDLARRVRPVRTVLVADAGLGTINAVRLALAQAADLAPVVHLNRFDPDDDLHRRNRDWLRDRDALTVTTTIEELTSAVAPDP